MFAPFRSSVADSDVEMTVPINFASPEDDIVHSDDEEYTMLPQILQGEIAGDVFETVLTQGLFNNCLFNFSISPC